MSYRVGTAGSAGRGLFAAKELAAGDLIFELKRPLVTALDTPALDYTCEWCFNGTGEAALGPPASPEEEINLLRCSGCKLVKYCNKTCQSQAWKHHHKYECKLFASFMPRVLPNASRMLVQLLLRKKKEALSEADWERLLALEHHAVHFRSSPPDHGRRQALQLTARAAKEYGGVTDGIEFCEALAGRIFINTQTLVNDIYHPLGQCLDPLPALTNHSCLPNAVIVFSGPVMSLRATAAMTEGTEITISYIDPTTAKAQRLSELSERYFFECHCPGCKEDLCFWRPLIPDNWKAPPGSETHNTPAHLKSLLDLDAAALACQRDADSALRNARVDQGTQSSADDQPPDAYYRHLCKGLAKYLQQPNLAHYPPGRQPLAKLRFDTAVELLSRSLFVPAIILSLQNYFDVDPYHFPEVIHPVRVVHTYTLSRLASQLAFMDSAGDGEVEQFGNHFGLQGNWFLVSLALLGEAWHCVGTSHGRTSRLAHQIDKEARFWIGKTGQSAAAVNILKDQKIGPSMGVRNAAVWPGVAKVAREGWRWYSGFVKGLVGGGVDEGVRLLTASKPANVPTLLKPPA